MSDYDPPVVCTTKVVNARKAHTCLECGNVIPAGARYERVKGLWEGQWLQFKTCIRCVVLRDSISHDPDGDGTYEYGALWCSGLITWNKVT